MACTNDNDGDGENAEPLLLDGLSVTIGEREKAENVQNRATSDFVVNTAADPTFDRTRLTGTGGWTLDVQIFDKNNNPYAPGAGTFTYSTAVSRWTSPTNVYFPNYHSPQVNATLHPAGWTTSTAIALDQSTSANLLLQDILAQNGSPYRIAPAHIPQLTLRHAYSMLDFIITDVDFDDVADDGIKVIAGGQEYTPYKVPGTTNHEFLVILPLGVSTPRVSIATRAGARYYEDIVIPSTAVNHCYCVKLIGIELRLSSVTVVDWVYGQALEGSYTTIASYPTFRGLPNTSVRLTYQNGLTQELDFNERGEATVKPAGRMVIAIGQFPIDPPIILDQMYVDLRPYLPN